MSEHEPSKRHPEFDAAHPHDALFKFTFSRPEHVEAELRCARVSEDLLAEMRQWLELLQELEADRARMGDSEALFWYAF